MVFDKVYKTVLTNGLTILVMPRTAIPKVSLQLWYNVGSKDEMSGQKGIAHLIEHMIFKGTDKLSESDINMIVHKLSGYCNAFTSYDYTGYLFDVPSQHWQEVLPIMADSMRNCTFKEELLNSELKAVIQELKMYKDDYASSLVEAMISQIFYDHPYHHPIIGYKQDLWNIKREALVDFYNYHYAPNNAVLVVVGDVHVEDVQNYAEKHFGHIMPNQDYQKEEFYHSFDLARSDTTLYRDIQQPVILLAWVIPGVKTRFDYVFDVMSWIIGAGKGSRLSRILIDELELVTEVESFVYDLFDHGVFFVHVEPKDMADAQKIIDIIHKELASLATEYVSDEELHRARKKTEVDFLSLVESNQKQAYLLGKYFVATGDEFYLKEYGEYPVEGLKDQIQTIVRHYLRPTVMYKGQVLPLPAGEHDYWLKLQEQSDLEDARVLAQITREAEVEEALHAHTIAVQPPKSFVFRTPESVTLDNGLKILFCNNPDISKIEVLLDLKSKYYYDPEDLQGLSMLTADVLQEGTSRYSAKDLASFVESYGMELNTFPGHVSLSMLSGDLATGLSILQDLMTNATCTEDSIDKIRFQIEAELKGFWDNPSQFSGQLLRELVYAKHPYHKNVLGRPETIKNITRSDVFDHYRKNYTPHGSRLVIVGDLSQYDIPALVERYLGAWAGDDVPDIVFPKLSPLKSDVIDHRINRDQIVLAYGGLSVSRKDPDFDALLLFDQIFTGGVLGSMSSRLFALRERSGLFYTIGGSLLAGVDVEPGMVYVKTIVSQDRLEEANKQIRAVIDTGARDMTDVELEEAQRALINSFVDNFSALRSMASTFLFLDKFELGFDYFEKRPEQLRAVTRDQVIATVGKYLDTSKLITLRVGRL